MACRADAFASCRENHQLIRKKDMIPTPSQPTRNWNMLFDVMRIIMENKKIIKYLKKRLMFGSEFIYHIENSRMDQDTKRAIGVKIIAYLSIVRLILMSMFVVNHQSMEILISWCVFMKWVIGSRLVASASLIRRSQFVFVLVGNNG